MRPFTNTLVFSLTVLSATMIAVSAASTTKDGTPTGSASPTTTETYYWERCQGGKGSGPSGFMRLCEGEHHGECVGNTSGTTTRAHDVEDCADVCTNANGCTGFEYDTHGDDATCTLFSVVTGLKRAQNSHLNTHECYIKEPAKDNRCKSVEMFSGRYQRMCDGRFHGFCRGTFIKPVLERDSAELCAAECDRNVACGGFEYDVDDDGQSCVLYGKVSGAERPDFSHTHECYAKLSFSPTRSASSTTTATNITTVKTNFRSTTADPKPSTAASTTTESTNKGGTPTRSASSTTADGVSAVSTTKDGTPTRSASSTTTGSTNKDGTPTRSASSTTAATNTTTVKTNFRSTTADPKPSTAASTPPKSTTSTMQMTTAEQKASVAVSTTVELYVLTIFTIVMSIF